MSFSWGYHIGNPAWLRRRATGGCRIIAQVGLPVSTAMSATVEAMKHLEIRSTVIATAYKETINQAVKKYYEDGGLEVLAMKGLEFPNPWNRSSCRIMPPIKLRASFIGSIQRLTVC
jgi:maleate cis-trans isomerase